MARCTDDSESVAPARPSLAITFILATVAVDALGFGIAAPVLPRIVMQVQQAPAAVASLAGTKYQDPLRSDLVVQVGPAWNDIVFSLPDPGRSPTLAQHR